MSLRHGRSLIRGPSGVGIGSHCEPFGLVFDTTRCHVYVCKGDGIDFDDGLPENLLHDLIMTGFGQIEDLGSFSRGEDALGCPQALEGARGDSGVSGG